MQFDLDRLLYPIMMNIRSLKNVFPQANQDLQSKLTKAILVLILINKDCQIKCEGMILSLMLLMLDYVTEGPAKVKLVFGADSKILRKQLNHKLPLMRKLLANFNFAPLQEELKEVLEFGDGFEDSEKEEENSNENFTIKITGHLREFNPEIKELQAKIDKLEQEIKILKGKLAIRQNSLEILTANHIKDVQHLKQQLIKGDLISEDSSLIQVTYFDSTLMLEPEIIDMINDKVRDIKQQYEKFVLQMMEQNKKRTEVQQQVKYIQPEYTIKELVKLICDKQPNQYQLWKFFSEIKTNQFFLSVITKQQFGYGIDYKEINEVVKDIRPEIRELINARTIMQDQISQLTANYLHEIDILKSEQFRLKMQGQEIRIDYEGRIQRILAEKDDQQIAPYTKLQSLEQQNTKLHEQILSINSEKRVQEMKCSLMIQNLKIILKLIDPKTKLIKIDQLDMQNSKSDIMKDILYKIRSIGTNVAFSIQQIIETTLYLENAISVTQLKQNTVAVEVQTELLCCEIISASEIIRPQQTKKSIIIRNVQHSSTQTDEKQLPSPTKTVTISNKHNTEQQPEYFRSFPCKTVESKHIEHHSVDKNNVFERLFTQSKMASERLRNIKPYLERLSEEEYQELYIILNLYSSRKIQESSPLQKLQQVILPQQEINKQSSTMQNEVNKIRRLGRSMHIPVNESQHVFEELDEQRETAQKVFETNRIETYRRRLKKLCPSPPPTDLTFSEKIRPRTQSKKSSNFKISY